MTYLKKTAVISPCRTYRYTLSREWNAERETVVFLMLNPSKANDDIDDPTIKRVVSIADGNGYGRLVVVNLFAFRATNSSAIRNAVQPVGPDNDAVIRRETEGRVVVCAWGARSKFRSPRLMDRPAQVLGLLRAGGARLRCLRLTEKGDPWHPLFIPTESPFMPFQETR